MIPRINLTDLNNASPIVLPATSLLVWNTNTTTGVGFYYWDGSKWAGLAGDNTVWKIKGNANTTMGTNFLGTTNAQGLDFRTNNTNRLRIPNDNQILAMSNGTAAKPFYAWNSNTGTGFWQAGSNILATSTNGVERMRILANGNIGIRTTNPIYLLQMTNGGIAIAGTATMSSFENSSNLGEALSVSNDKSSNTNNALSGSISYSGTAAYPGAVAGYSIASSGYGNGVWGEARGADAVGVYGLNTKISSGGIAVLADGYAAGVTDWYNISDQKIKRNIINMDGLKGLNTIMKLRSVEYDFDIEKYPKLNLETKHQYGFIAQEVEKLIPGSTIDFRLMEHDTTSSQSSNNRIQTNEGRLVKLKAMSYAKIIPFLVSAIQEQQKIIEDKSAKIEELENRMNALEEKMNLLGKSNK